MSPPENPKLSDKIRLAEKELTKGLIKWQRKRQGRPQPEEEQLDSTSDQIVDEAHKVLKTAGKNIFVVSLLAKTQMCRRAIVIACHRLKCRFLFPQ